MLQKKDVWEGTGVLEGEGKSCGAVSSEAAEACARVGGWGSARTWRVTKGNRPTIRVWI